jgi:hypothetical protein
MMDYQDPATEDDTNQYMLVQIADYQSFKQHEWHYYFGLLAFVDIAIALLGFVQQNTGCS